MRCSSTASSADRSLLRRGSAAGPVNCPCCIMVLCKHWALVPGRRQKVQSASRQFQAGRTRRGSPAGAYGSGTALFLALFLPFFLGRLLGRLFLVFFRVV